MSTTPDEALQTWVEERRRSAVDDAEGFTRHVLERLDAPPKDRASTPRRRWRLLVGAAALALFCLRLSPILEWAMPR